MQITKKNGVVVVFDDEKVKNSILKANMGIPGEAISNADAAAYADEVFSAVTEHSEIITTAEVRKAVVAVLKAHGSVKTAENYESFADKKK